MGRNEICTIKTQQSRYSKCSTAKGGQHWHSPKKIGRNAAANVIDTTIIRVSPIEDVLRIKIKQSCRTTKEKIVIPR